MLICDILLVISGVAIDSEYPECSTALKMCGLEDNHPCVELPKHIQNLRSGCEIASNTILVIFILEIFFRAYAIGIISYISTPSYLFDALVIFASLMLEIAEGSQHHDTGLLVLARTWRFLTLVHGVRGLGDMSNSGDTNNNEAPFLNDSRRSREYVDDDDATFYPLSSS